MARRSLAALGLIALAVLLYAASFQDWVFGDGPQLIDALVFHQKLWMHVLYIPAARAIDAWLPGMAPIRALQWVSILGGGAGAGGVYLITRHFGATPARAVLTSLLVVATPAVWFFATTIEVHALHFGVVALATYAALRIPWNRPALGLSLTLSLIPLLYLTHKSGALLAPGWLALALYARERNAGQRPQAKTVLLAGAGVALGFLASIQAAILLVPDRNSLGDTVAFIARFTQGLSWSFVTEALLVGLGCLLPLAALGLRNVSREELLLLGAFLLPIFGFFVFYGEANKGGYFVSAIPFLAVLAERALPHGRVGAAVVLVSITIQGALSWSVVRGHASQFSMEERLARAAAVRGAIGDSGTVLSFEPSHQPVTLDVPGVREVNYREDFMRTAARGMDPVTSASETITYLRFLLNKGPGRVALDLGFKVKAEKDQRLAPYVREVERAALREFGPLRPDPRFPMVVVR